MWFSELWHHSLARRCLHTERRTTAFIFTQHVLPNTWVLTYQSTKCHNSKDNTKTTRKCHSSPLKKKLPFISSRKLYYNMEIYVLWTVRKKISNYSKKSLFKSLLYRHWLYIVKQLREIFNTTKNVPPVKTINAHCQCIIYSIIHNRPQELSSMATLNQWKQKTFSRIQFSGVWRMWLL